MTTFRRTRRIAASAPFFRAFEEAELDAFISWQQQ